MHEFAGTSEEVRVIVANSELAVKRGDVDAAVHMLNNVPPTSSAYAKAQMVKAQIYLRVRYTTPSSSSSSLLSALSHR